jgi:RNA polymerase sigma-70 factor (ECF subfamily)
VIQGSTTGLFPEIGMGKPSLGSAASPASSSSPSALDDEPGDLALDAACAARVRAMVETHLPFVWRTARRLGVPAADVDDVTQKVFWLASRRLALVPPTAVGERGYLFRTTLGLAANARRTQRRRREIDLPDGAANEPRDPTLNPEQLAERHDARDRALAILDGMPDEMRAVFVLFEIEELRTAEIAQLMELPVGTVASRLRRAREHAEAELHRLEAQSRRVETHRPFATIARTRDPDRHLAGNDDRPHDREPR